MKQMKPLYVAVALVMLLSQTLVAQDARNVSLLSNYGKGEGESKAVFAAGSLVFYGLGNKVQIASFSNPAAPVKIGSVILSEIVEGLVRTSIGGTQYLAVSGGSKMWLINVQNPTTPSLTSTVDVAPGTTCEGIATSGSYAYVAAGGAGLRIYSISNPAAPTLVASMDTLAYCESVVISGQYAYIAAAERSHIVDITNPAAPVYVGRINAYGGYHQYINVRSGYAYVCDYNAGLAVVNVTNPASPVNVVSLPTIPRIGCVVFDGNYAYIAAGDSGLKVYNVVNPASPVFAGRVSTTGRAAFVSYGAITIAGTPTGHIFVSNRNPAPGMSAVNVSVPGTPTTSAFLAALASPTGSAFTPFYANGKVYVAYGAAGLRIVDVSNPTSATLLSTTPLGGDSRGVVVSGNYAYVAARDSGVFVVDVTDPSNPAKLNTLKITRANGIAASGAYLYVAAGDSGMGIVNNTTPATPVLLGYSHPGGQKGENVAVAGNVIGLTDYSKILFYDNTTPAAPVGKGVTTSFKTGNEGFAIAGNFAYVPDGDTMKIFNIANLQTPTQVSKIFTGGYGYMSAVAGNYCYVASEATGVRVIDITNPAVPTEAGYYDGVPQSRGVIANGAYCYVAEKTDGLSVYRNDLLTSVAGEGTSPLRFDLLQNYPNPFNPSTEIGFRVSVSGVVKITVFDMLGREVALLVNEKREPGNYTATWNANGLASGMYFYRMEASTFSSVRKMMLIK
jgi:hypothetical protein